jgi:hypothetical protein
MCTTWPSEEMPTALNPCLDEGCGLGGARRNEDPQSGPHDTYDLFSRGRPVREASLPVESLNASCHRRLWTCLVQALQFECRGAGLTASLALVWGGVPPTFGRRVLGPSLEGRL